MRGCCLPRRLACHAVVRRRQVMPKSNVGGSLGDNRTKAGNGGRRGGREVSMRDETVFRVTNSRYHTNPSSDRIFFRRR